ncbi:MAG: cation-translocating P-type ATPase [bacterium]|nr:cation-translocating P-type ATPase [bacterium]
MKNNNNYYNETVEDLYIKMGTPKTGLTNEEAQRRLLKNGENKLTERKKKSNLLLFIEQFNDFMIILLIVASIFSAIVSYIRNESYVDSIIIIVIVVINAILSFIQEKKADAAIEELNKMFITNNYVIRNGVKELIDVKNVVVGDIIELEAGDYVSADARVITSEGLEVNESTLTGESKSIKKDNENITTEKELYERKNMVYAGCNVTNGHAFVLVCATGMNTELGKIATSLIDKKSDLTPLQKKVNHISKTLTYIILAIIVVMIIAGLLMKNDFFDVLMLSISLAVAAIPEGLSSIITIILSLGMTAMAKRNVIIRKMASVETLGSTDIICSDKTGTITQNKMLVKAVYVNDHLYNDHESITNSELLTLCAGCCHNVQKNNDNYMGDETEVSIYKYLENNDFLASKKIERLKEFPFDSDRKMMSTINSIDGKNYSFTKGSLDSVINRCSHYVVNGNVELITPEYKEKIFQIEKQLSAKSLRLLAFAYKDEMIEHPEESMTFIGLIGMMDPPRETVTSAIQICNKAGLKPIMITGDSINTAIAIAKEVNIIDNDDKAIEGKDIDKMTDNELKKAVEYYQVYARISPSAKLRIVEALQSQGHIVAMTGDGVNDAPAIQKADIGIGMGITGTEVVKKVADCILVDDSFSTIVDGVEEGRRITANIKKVILYLLAGNIVEVILVFASMLMNMEMFNTLQLLWLNLVTDSIPAIMLAFEKAENDVMENSPANKSSESFFTPLLTAKIVIGAIFKSIVMMCLYVYFAKTANINVASSLLFIFLIGNELLYSFSCRSLKKSVINKHFFDNTRLSLGVGAIVLIQIIVLTTGLSKFFIVKGISLTNLLITLGVLLITFIIGEMFKPVYNKLFKDYKVSK